MAPASDLRVPLKGDKGIAAAAARVGRPVCIPDVRLDPRYTGTGFPAVCELAVPAQIPGRVLGVIDVESERPAAFGEGDVEMLSILASQAALALENVRLHAEQRRQTEELAGLEALSRRISASLDLRATLDAVVRAAFEIIPCALAEVSL